VFFGEAHVEGHHGIVNMMQKKTANPAFELFSITTSQT
jgi:hypothetical protein